MLEMEREGAIPGNSGTSPYGKPNGNSFVGFLDWHSGSYRVGQVRELFTVSTRGGNKDIVVATVRCFGEVQGASFSKHLWLSQLSHPVLGMHLVSSQTDENVYIPTEDIVGHVALCPVQAPDKVEALLTIQLSKVSDCPHNCDSNTHSRIQDINKRMELPLGKSVVH
jgi:hypothetical protein